MLLEERADLHVLDGVGRAAESERGVTRDGRVAGEAFASCAPHHAAVRLEVLRAERGAGAERAGDARLRRGGVVEAHRAVRAAPLVDEPSGVGSEGRVGIHRNEVDIGRVDEVEAGDETIGEPSGGAPVKLDAGNCAIHILRVADGSELVEVRGEVAHARIARAARRAGDHRAEAVAARAIGIDSVGGDRLTRSGVGHHAHAASVVVGHPHAATHEGAVERDVELVGGLRLHVRAEGEAIEIVVRERAGLLLVGERPEVVEGIVTAARAERILLVAPRAKRAAQRALHRVVAGVDVARERLLHRPELSHHGIVDVREAAVPGEVVVIVEVVGDILQDALLGAEGEVVPTRLALFRLDHDDAGRRLRAVERGCGGTLHHLDAGDVLRVDVIEARDRLAVAEVVGAGSRSGLVAHADPVHVNERVVVLREAGGAADTDLRRAADGARRLRDIHARHLRVEKLGEVRRGGLVGEGGRVDSFDIGAQLDAPRVARGNGGNHLIEGDDPGGEHEVEGDLGVRLDGDDLRDRCEADGSGLDAVASGIDLEGEAAVGSHGSGNRAVGGAHLCTGDRLADVAGRAGDTADDSALLRERGGDRHSCEQRQ